MRPGLARRTALGAATGAAAFLGLGLYLNAATGAAVLSNFGPLTMLAVIGATVGGLVAPLFGRR